MTRRILILTALMLVVLPATASAQATRTWVSGVGDDANPCSRTAPCKTWQGAINKTASGGEVDAIDHGSFGGATISKGITLDGNGVFAGTTLCSPGNAFTISAPANAKVTLRDLRINGCRNTASPGTNGVKLNSAATLRIDDSRITGFSNAGVALEPNHLKSRAIIQDTSIHDNGVYGVFARPAAGGNLKATLTHTRLDDNGNGLIASSPFGPARVRVFDSVVTDSGQDSSTGFGLWSAGANSTIRVGDSRITGNTKGLHFANGATLLSYTGNIVDDNTTDGTFTGTVQRK